ncbi:hypothetical protein [Streptomyces sp. NPDC088736]|uniref:hypothetical protein n=1 Tax=Streptomyces sp. NPDC088736 TaxID=3365881 RepID=UPI00381051CC
MQALRLARAAGDVHAGAYVLTAMSFQTMLREYPHGAADMAEAAFERAKHAAAPRVLAFAKLAEARAYGRAGDANAAGAVLAAQPATRESSAVAEKSSLPTASTSSGWATSFPFRASA